MSGQIHALAVLRLRKKLAVGLAVVLLLREESLSSAENQTEILHDLSAELETF
jgi:hypothetical protein